MPQSKCGVLAITLREAFCYNSDMKTSIAVLVKKSEEENKEEAVNVPLVVPIVEENPDKGAGKES